MKKNCVFTNEESRWNAVVKRDQAAEGCFYYAVRTTGVFCRPGCSSRLPVRENVEFFNTYREAELAGYRPCKRCEPGASSPRERLVEVIVQACRRLEQLEENPKLDELAEEAGLSPWHFHRLFKKNVGVTPKQYAATQQARRFRDNLKTSRSVTEAIYDSGFGSSSRAYEKARDRLAMTPSRYKRGAAELTIRYSTAPCFLGWVIAAATDRGICAIEFGDDPRALPAKVQASFPNAYLEEAGPDFSAVIQKVIAFIEAPGKGIELPLDIQGTAFQQRVWQVLREVPPGITVSYAEIADHIGSSKAVRAVAQACAANKLAIAIPCHRVVRSDGKLSGYRWGIDRKRMLLLRESDNSKGLYAHTEKADKANIKKPEPKRNLV
jgi:AraC family transcriptional regulator, regulatory protein of adaptative response / methylated-DNA-[protein]-cysteine methyltransferase